MACKLKANMSQPANKSLHADSIQLSRFLLKEKAAKTAPTYSPVNEALVFASEHFIVSEVR
jgi:hypothetical protein